MAKPYRKTAFISLGPTCVPAEILKAGGLRTCTYGFDWFRSGGIYVKHFLETDIDTFLKFHVYNPSILLEQCNNPETIKNNTTELQRADPIYGYPYLYNPHRNLHSKATRDYFKRSFIRLKNAIQNESLKKEFILADYTNKLHASFLNSWERICEFLAKTICNAEVKNFSISIIRISLAMYDHDARERSHWKKYLTKKYNKEIMINGIKCRYFEYSIHSNLDLEEIRKHTYRLIAKQIFRSID